MLIFNAQFTLILNALTPSQHNTPVSGCMVDILSPRVKIINTHTPHLIAQLEKNNIFYLIPNFGKSLQLSLTDILNSLTFTEHVAGSCRFTAYYGNIPYNYSYSYHPAANLSENLSIRKCLDCINEFFSDAGLNSVLINYYPCGASKLNFHSDDEIKIDDESFIFTLSYGHRRTMAFRSLNHRKHLINVTLTDCSLLLFSKASQHIYQHSILPETGATGRVSLTFRKLIEGDSRNIPI